MDVDPIIGAGLGLAALVGLLSVVRRAIVPDGVGFEDLFGIRIDLRCPAACRRKSRSAGGPSASRLGAGRARRHDHQRTVGCGKSISGSSRRSGARHRTEDREDDHLVERRARIRARRVPSQARARSLRIRSAASFPGAPMTQPPGCVPEPHW